MNEREDRTIQALGFPVPSEETTAGILLHHASIRSTSAASRTRRAQPLARMMPGLSARGYAVKRKSRRRPLSSSFEVIEIGQPRSLLKPKTRGDLHGLLKLRMRGPEYQTQPEIGDRGPAELRKPQGGPARRLDLAVEEHGRTTGVERPEMTGTLIAAVGIMEIETDAETTGRTTCQRASVRRGSATSGMEKATTLGAETGRDADRGSGRENARTTGTAMAARANEVIRGPEARRPAE